MTKELKMRILTLAVTGTAVLALGARAAEAAQQSDTDKWAASATVVARYGDWYQGDDDLFAHCLILKNGNAVILFEGLKPVTMKAFEVPSDLFQTLNALRAEMPETFPKSSYAGYNFIGVDNSAKDQELAVFDDGNGQYVAAPQGSEVSAVVRQICQIDAPQP